MKKLFLITIILLLQSFPSFGDPNGNGIICDIEVGGVGRFIDDEKTIRSKVGFSFLNNEVVESHFHLNVKNDKVVRLLFPKVNFLVTKRKIKWRSNNINYVLDRESLKLKENYTKGENKFLCKVFSFNNYFLEMDKLKKKYQKLFDKKFNKLENKI